jgi:hypothetical protein
MQLDHRSPSKKEIVLDNQDDESDTDPIDMIHSLIRETDESNLKQSTSIHKQYQSKQIPFNDYYEQNKLDIISEEESARHTVVFANLSKKHSINGNSYNQQTLMSIMPLLKMIRFGRMGQMLRVLHINLTLK